MAAGYHPGRHFFIQGEIQDEKKRGSLKSGHMANFGIQYFVPGGNYESSARAVEGRYP